MLAPAAASNTQVRVIGPILLRDIQQCRDAGTAVHREAFITGDEEATSISTQGAPLVKCSVSSDKTVENQTYIISPHFSLAHSDIQKG